MPDGCLGTIAARHEEEGGVPPSVSFNESGHRLAAVAGTSTCHLVQCPGIETRQSMSRWSSFFKFMLHRRARKESLLEVFGVHTVKSKRFLLSTPSLRSDKCLGRVVPWLVDE